jgi:hypothetical protein
MYMEEVIAVRTALAHYPVETGLSFHDKSTQNSLLTAISGITTHIGDLKEKAKEYYFEVLLSLYPSPSCGGKLHMTSQTECSCS